VLGLNPLAVRGRRRFPYALRAKGGRRAPGDDLEDGREFDYRETVEVHAKMR
jgi:hypothetical protein